MEIQKVVTVIFKGFLIEKAWVWALWLNKIYMKWVGGIKFIRYGFYDGDRLEIILILLIF